MDDGSPGLSVGFEIDTGGSFARLDQLDSAMDATAGRVTRDAALIERATGNMVQLGGATAQVVAFGNASDRATQNVLRDAAQVERSGEAIVRQLERQNAAFGKSRDELRSLRAEERAAAADRVGNADLAARIREQEAALFDKQLAAGRRTRAEANALAEDQAMAAQRAVVAKEAEAQAVRNASFAHQLFESRAREGMIALREHEAATQRDAAALANLRAMIDPAAAAQDRLNVELAEARRLLTAAGASTDDLARAEDALWTRSRRSTQQHREMGAAARGNAFSLQQLAIQMPDVVQGLLTGQKPMTVFIQQGGQIVQVAMMAEGGIRGLGKEVGLLALRFAPVIGLVAAAAAGFGLFVRWINEGVGNDQLTRDLGKITGGADATKQELFKLREETVTWGAVSRALFKEVGKDIAEQFTGDMKGMSKDVKTALDDMTSYGKAALAGMYAGVAGMRSYLGELEKGGIKGIGKMLIGQGDPALLDRTFGASYRAADTYLTKLGARVRKTAIQITREDLAKKIGFNSPPTAKVDGHAAALGRDADAVEAQIRNLYALADAYGVSGAEALIAEARVKAESQAIRQRGDVEVAVAREVRLAVAQRVSDAAKSTAGLRDQLLIQKQITAEVAAGNVPAQLAGEMLRDRMADLPLLAALEAARRVKDGVGAVRAAQALDEQRAAREKLTDAERSAAIQSSLADGRDRLEELREETRLIGATDAARIQSLATLRAVQQADRNGWTGAEGAAWVAQQVAIAVETQRLARAQNDYNDAVSATADRWDTVARNVQNAASGMAGAFGAAGRAIGDIASIYSSFRANEERARLRRDENIRRGADAEREQARYALEMSGARLGMYGDMAAAAKGYFKEGTGGYNALATAERAFRAIEFAMSVRAIAQDAIETGSKIATSAARTAANAVEAVTKAIASLPFPANIAAGAATVAALAAIGVSVVGGLGGGGKNTLAKANDGTGTVLGDPGAKSESIRRALDALKEVDTLTLNTSRDMLSSLRSIESSIGGVASLIVRAGNVNANSQVTEGFKPNLIGSVLGKIPLIGGILGGLFGSKTSVVGGGLYGGAQSLGSILTDGFDASYYSDTKKTSKFLGITTGTKYSTSYTGADAGLESQFTQILRDFNSTVAAAAGPLGTATGDIEARLRGFVVDIGKIDLQGLSGAEIQEKLTAVFGAAADRMAGAAFPGIERFQKVGEGVFETMVRVASTAEAVTASLDKLGFAARGIGLDAKIGVAAQFESVSAMTSAADAFFDRFYTPVEQNAARLSQLDGVFVRLGVSMPATLAAYRSLIEAQDLTSAAGQSTYATLIQLAPAFADLQSSLTGAKSAADILAERGDLERKLLELAGDTAAIRALDLAKLDVSNRALQQQVWAVQDAQEAAKAAEDLRKAWSDVGTTIQEEVRRIRGLNDATGATGFMTLQGQFNAQSALARAGDQDAAKLLPGMSQALLKAAGDSATSRQELDRVQAQTAASLEATFAALQRYAAASPSASAERLLAAMDVAPGAAGSSSAASSTEDAAGELRRLREEVAAMRQDNNSGHAATAGNTGKMAKTLERVTEATGGEAIAVASVAA